jgi:hypothetical protein
MKRERVIRKSTHSKNRRLVSDKKTKVLSARVMVSFLRELKSLYPNDMTESEIINDLVKEKLARAKFDQWMASLEGKFDLEDFDSESLR